MRSHIPEIAIMASGSGTTADAYARAIHEGIVNHNISLVIASSETAGILEKVDRWNDEYNFDTEAVVINHRTHPGGVAERGQTDEESEAIAGLLNRRGIGSVAMLGYMRIARGALLDEYANRIVNTHPGPLPETADTYGMHAAQRVLDLGLSESRHTVHVVTRQVDAGPIIAAHPVPVLPGDSAETLNQRIQLVEKATMPYAIDAFFAWQEAANYRWPTLKRV